nr:MAG TPA: hypothetical protein [Caudoviricetes sp.]
MPTRLPGVKGRLGWVGMCELGCSFFEAWGVFSAGLVLRSLFRACTGGGRGYV